MERETAVARKRGQEAETAIMQELKDTTAAESAGATNRKPKTTFEEILNAIGDCQSDLASSHDEQEEEDEEDDEEYTQLGKLNDDDEPGWVMGTTSNPVQRLIESFRQKEMRLDELMQPGWGYSANYFGERDMKYRTAKLKVPAVVKPQIDTTAATTPPTTLRNHMLTLYIVLGREMPALTS